MAELWELWKVSERRVGGGRRMLAGAPRLAPRYGEPHSQEVAHSTAAIRMTWIQS